MKKQTTDPCTLSSAIQFSVFKPLDILTFARLKFLLKTNFIISCFFWVPLIFQFVCISSNNCVEAILRIRIFLYFDTVLLKVMRTQWVSFAIICGIFQILFYEVVSTVSKLRNYRTRKYKPQSRHDSPHLQPSKSSHWHWNCSLQESQICVTNNKDETFHRCMSTAISQLVKT